MFLYDINKSKYVKWTIREQFRNENKTIRKISLEHEGMLLRCVKNTTFRHIYKCQYLSARRTKPIEINKNDIIMYLGCWFFPKKIQMNKTTASLINDDYIKLHYHNPQYSAIVNFLYGDKIFRREFLGMAPHTQPYKKFANNKKENVYNNIYNHPLYKASLYMYEHFEVVALEGK